MGGVQTGGVEGKMTKASRFNHCIISNYVASHPEMKLVQVAEKFGCSPSVVTVACRKSGVEGKKAGRNRSQKSYAVCEYAKANPLSTLQEIADQFGISRERVRQTLKQWSGETGREREKVRTMHRRMSIGGGGGGGGERGVGGERGGEVGNESEED